ncbi:MAG: aminoglycoside phosphotransferase family protein [Candidatus Thorarchaeota archaeon]
MTRRYISKVHGFSITDLEKLLSESCELFDNRVILEREVIGGWSNINIRGTSSDFSFILKMPWSIEPSPTYYDYLFHVSKFYGKLGVTTSPLSIGKLSNQKETPFILLEYIDGVIYESIDALSNQETIQFKECLKIFHQHKPPGLHSHFSPLDYILTYHWQVESHPGLTCCSKDLSILIDSFNKTLEAILEYAEILGPWPMTVMHGDLWIPNVVFQSSKASLIDLESCSLGESHYDLAHLIESPDHLVSIPSFLLDSYERDRVEELQPIALCWLIIWSLERLLSMDFGLVEANLNTIESRAAVMDYTRAKIIRLNEMFS